MMDLYYATDSSTSMQPIKITSHQSSNPNPLLNK